MKKLYLCLVIAVAAVGSMSAREAADSVAQSISFADRVMQRHTNVSVVQPEELNARLLRTASSTSSASSGEVTSGAGYRLQVYSNNNARTAKAEASARASQIAERFPQWATYVQWDAPYWRLRVGDFPSYHDATSAMSEMKQAFPAFQREIRVVRDRVKVNN